MVGASLHEGVGPWIWIRGERNPIIQSPWALSAARLKNLSVFYNGKNTIKGVKSFIVIGCMFRRGFKKSWLRPIFGLSA